jgi:hypothetical protein
MESTKAEAAARTAAEAWLSAIDQGDADGSWREASTTFRKAVGPRDWGSSLERVQDSVGRAVERSFRSAEYHTELPGAPDGHYVILKYDTRFEHKAHGEETVVPQLDDDGVWRVSGYWVK